MKLSRRGRRDWRIILWIGLTSAVVSALFGMSIRPDEVPWSDAALTSVATSLMIATPISLLELRGRRSGLLRRLRRLPLSVFFSLKVVAYLVIIFFGLIVGRLLFAPEERRLVFDGSFETSIVFAIVMSVVANLVFEMGGLLGYGTLKNLLTGRYVQPRRERRAFLLIDIKNSTGLAERLGPVHFHELLNAFFREVADAALQCDAEIHKYVGDEAILTWNDEAALRRGDALACPFTVRDLIAVHGAKYRERFGVVPEFRAALHFGEIVAGEIGDVRREIAYVGDTLNVAARLLEAAKELGHDVLVSADLLERAAMPDGLSAEKLPMLSVRGRAAPLGVSALGRSR